MIDLFLPLFVDVKEIRKQIDCGMDKSAEELTSKTTLAHVALMWVKEELRRRRAAK